MGGGETVYKFTDHSFTHSFMLNVYVWHTAYLYPSPHPHVSYFHPVGNKLKVNNNYVLYYINLSV
jgi:hypothetical protein